MGGWLFVPILVGMLGASPASMHAQESTSERWQDLWARALTLRPHVHGQLSSVFDFGETEDIFAQARLEALLTSTLETDPTPQTAHALGVLRLLQRNYDEAITRLEQAAKVGNDLASQSDLAVLYLSRGREHQSGLDYVRALESAERALEIESEYPPAVYNRALALDGLHLGLTAQAEYEHFLSLSVVRPAGREHATDRLEALRNGGEAEAWDSALEGMEAAVRIEDQEKIDELVAEFPLHARQHAGEVLLPTWAELSATEQTEESAEKLTFARQIGQALQRLGSDSTIANTVAEIEAALARFEFDRVATWRKALLDFREGRNTKPEEGLTSALDKLRGAAETFLATDSSFAPWAEFYRGYFLCYAQDYGQASSILRSLRAKLTEANHRILLNRIDMLLGLLDLYAGDYAAALSFFEGVERSARERPVSERPNGLDTLLAETLTVLGRLNEAWVSRVKVLESSLGATTPELRITVLQEASAALESERWTKAVVWFGHEAVALAGRRGRPALTAEAMRIRGRARYRAGELTTAVTDFQAARSSVAELEDQQLGTRMQADLWADEGVLLVELELDSERAIEALDEAWDRYSALGNGFRAPQIYLAKARAFERLNRNEEAAQAYAGALELREDVRHSLNSPQNRTSYFDMMQDAFEHAIRFEARVRTDEERALELAEQARARTLWDLANPETEESTLPIDRLLSEIPEDVVLLEYMLSADGLLLWCLRRNDLQMIRLNASEKDLVSQVSELRRLLESRGSEETIRSLAEQLHETLLSPVRSDLQAEDRLIIVPDKVLFELPFAVLIDSQTGRFLIEDHALGVAPSASLFIEQTNRLRDFPESQRRSLLAVGNPEFARDSYPDLDSLPGALQEVERVRKQYERARVLTESRATLERLLDVLEGVSVLHVAAHVSSKPNMPETSALLLAPDGKGSDGLLRAADIMSWDLSNLEVVVLSACRSVGRYKRGREGVAGIARPFLAAGVPTVVASLWDVDDEAVMALMERFHCLLAQGASPNEALQQAQLDAIRESPMAWAGFVVIGGHGRSIHESSRKDGACLTTSR